MTTIMIVLLCIDAILVTIFLAYVIVSMLNKDKEQIEEVAVAKEEKVVEEPKNEEIKEQVVENEDIEDDRFVVKRVPFAQKMLTLDAKTQIYYEKIHNAFRGLRKINSRISMKGVSYRLGRKLVAKLSVRGKTLRLHLALNVNEFQQNVYFQKDLSEVKAYAEVPFMVKVKSDRGLNKALTLIDSLCEKHGIEQKAHFTQIDAIKELTEKN